MLLFVYFGLILPLVVHHVATFRLEIDHIEKALLALHVTQGPGTPAQHKSRRYCFYQLLRESNYYLEDSTYPLDSIDW